MEVQYKNDSGRTDKPAEALPGEGSGHSPVRNGVPCVVVERFEVHRWAIELTGWAHGPGELLKGIAVERSPGATVETLQTRLRRPDVAAAFPRSSVALLSGFACHITIDRILSPRVRFMLLFSGGSALPLKMSRAMKIAIWDRFLRGLGHAYLGWVKPLKRRLMPPLPTPTNSPSGISVAPVRQRYVRPLRAEVVLPVHNARTHVERVLPKLCADPEISRLWIVDDASTDSVLIELLDRAAAEFPQVELLRNGVNQGFVRAVNQALHQIEDNCVILNTDVDVPRGWVTRLLEPIRDDSSIASTTPFSNCGTILSFPLPCEDNHVFDRLDVEAIDRHFRTFRPHAFLVEVPTGVGFCMAMSRLALKEIGGFDEDLFGDGYGEENDWCRRAVLQGFRHVAVPNLYVYHAHGGSFREEDKQRLLERNLKRLAQRHPSYPDAVHTFIRQDPLKMHRDLATLKVLAHECSDGVAITIDHERGGGANSFRASVVQDIVSSAKLSVMVAWRATRGGYWIRARHSMASVSFAVPDAEDLFDILGTLPVTELNINSLVFAPNVTAILSDLSRYVRQNPRVEVTFYLHDYHPLCPSHNLLNSAGEFCGLPDVTVCGECLRSNEFAADRMTVKIAAWREAWARFLNDVGVIRTFSEESAEIFRTVFPECAERIITKGHKPPDLQGQVSRAGRELVVGVAGNINHAKGGTVINQLVRQDLFPIVVLGKFHTGKEQEGRLQVHGEYRLPELHTLIDRYGITLGFVPSVWPETYNLVADELMALGLPVACFDVGAHAERVRGYARGLVLPLALKNDPAELAARIRRFHAGTGPATGKANAEVESVL